jgi:hypothetical protein
MQTHKRYVSSRLCVENYSVKVLRKKEITHYLNFSKGNDDKEYLFWAATIVLFAYTE